MYVRMKKVKVLVKNLKKYPFFGNILDIWDILDKRSLIIKYLFDISLFRSEYVRIQINIRFFFTIFFIYIYLFRTISFPISNKIVQKI